VVWSWECFCFLEIWRCCSLRRGVVVVVYTQCLVQDTHNGSTTTEQHDAGHTRNRKKQAQMVCIQSTIYKIKEERNTQWEQSQLTELYRRIVMYGVVSLARSFSFSLARLHTCTQTLARSHAHTHAPITNKTLRGKEG